MHIPTSSQGASPNTGFNLRAALFVALAVFAQEAAWNFYDAQVPAVMRQYTTSAALIGLLMGMDNILGLFIQPWMAHRSDHTRSRWGRRMPYLLLGAPVAAVFYALIPWANSMPLLIAAMFCFAVVANSFKAVTESLIADFQPPRHRGKGTAIAKTAVALTVLTTAAVSWFVVDHNSELAFAIPAALMVAGILVAASGLDEGHSHAQQQMQAQAADEPQAATRLITPLRDIWRDPNRSRLLLIVTVFATAGVWSALRSQTTPYAMEVLGLTRGQAGSLGLPSGLAFMAVALPISIWSDRANRFKVCGWGLLALVLGCIVAFAGATTATTMAGLTIAACGYAAFAVNGIVILWNMAPSPRVLGLYTGLYGIAAALGSTLGPALLGLLVDLTGWRLLMLHGALLAACALALLHRASRASRTTAAALAI